MTGRNDFLINERTDGQTQGDWWGGGTGRKKFSRLFYLFDVSGRRNYTSEWSAFMRTAHSTVGWRETKSGGRPKRGQGERFSSSRFVKWLSVNSDIRRLILHNWIISFRLRRGRMKTYFMARGWKREEWNAVRLTHMQLSGGALERRNILIKYLGDIRRRFYLQTFMNAASFRFSTDSRKQSRARVEGNLFDVSQFSISRNIF